MQFCSARICYLKTSDGGAARWVRRCLLPDLNISIFWFEDFYCLIWRFLLSDLKISNVWFEDFYCLIWRFLLPDLKIWLPNLFVSSRMRRFLLPNLFAWEDFCCLICLFHLIHNVFCLIVFTMNLFVQIDGIVGDTSCYSACWLQFSFALFIPFPIYCCNKMNVE